MSKEKNIVKSEIPSNTFKRSEYLEITPEMVSKDKKGHISLPNIKPHEHKHLKEVAKNIREKLGVTGKTPQERIKNIISGIEHFLTEEAKEVGSKPYGDGILSSFASSIKSEMLRGERGIEEKIFPEEYWEEEIATAPTTTTQYFICKPTTSKKLAEVM